MFRNLRFVYVTTKNRQEAKNIASAIVEEKLAACANIIDGMESVYHWKGKIETDKECVLILKTTYSNMSRLTKRVKELHSYEVPCIISLNLAEQEGNQEYLDWMIHSVHKPMPSMENSDHDD
jgi:periplasmic divalent cation tolerance protein